MAMTLIRRNERDDGGQQPGVYSRLFLFCIRLSDVRRRKRIRQTKTGLGDGKNAVRPAGARFLTDCAPEKKKNACAKKYAVV